MKIDLSNIYRVVLTEVLPYEMPLAMDNYEFYKRLVDGSWSKVMINLTGTGAYNDWLIPFNYAVGRSVAEAPRQLSLMHPCSQVCVAEFYRDYAARMQYLCGLSPFSIRHIDKVARTQYSIEQSEYTEDDKLYGNIEIEEKYIELKYRSYFTYKNYDLLYKFFDGGDFLRLEQKYSMMLKLDISSCFYSIYTHSVAWAVKGKEDAKAHMCNQSFEKDFDTLIQHTNYNETNGILVGPEVSRIFAEIIFQRIDLNVVERLKSYRLSLGRDYEIRRYVDDHFIFANSEEHLHTIEKTITEEMHLYHLHINKAKRQQTNRPFASCMDVVKQRVKQLVNECVIDIIDSQKLNLSPYVALQRFAKSLRLQLLDGHANYSDMSAYALSFIKKKIVSASQSSAVQCKTAVAVYVLQVAFHLFNLDINFSNSVKLCGVIAGIIKMRSDADYQDEVKNTIKREAKRTLDIYSYSHHDTTNIEIQNILVVLNRTTGYTPSAAVLCKCMGIEKSSPDTFCRLDYFQICTLLDVMKDEPQYDELKKGIIAEIAGRFARPQAFKHADICMMYLDLMACPYIIKKQKMAFVKVFKQAKKDNKAAKTLRLVGDGRKWFYNWTSNINIIDAIEKKSYHPPYE